jgi:hypothetical protein
MIRGRRVGRNTSSTGRDLGSRLTVRRARMSWHCTNGDPLPIVATMHRTLPDDV